MRVWTNRCVLVYKIHLISIFFEKFKREEKKNVKQNSAIFGQKKCIFQNFERDIGTKWSSSSYLFFFCPIFSFSNTIFLHCSEKPFQIRLSLAFSRILEKNRISGVLSSEYGSDMIQEKKVVSRKCEVLFKTQQQLSECLIWQSDTFLISTKNWKYMLSCIIYTPSGHFFCPPPQKKKKKKKCKKLLNLCKNRNKPLFVTFWIFSLKLSQKCKLYINGDYSDGLLEYYLNFFVIWDDFLFQFLKKTVEKTSFFTSSTYCKYSYTMGIYSKYCW